MRIQSTAWLLQVQLYSGFAASGHVLLRDSLTLHAAVSLGVKMMTDRGDIKAEAGTLLVIQSARHHELEALIMNAYWAHAS
jgi:hypothetical protein